MNEFHSKRSFPGLAFRAALSNPAVVFCLVLLLLFFPAFLLSLER